MKNGPLTAKRGSQFDAYFIGQVLIGLARPYRASPQSVQIVEASEATSASNKMQIISAVKMLSFTLPNSSFPN